MALTADHLEMKIEDDKANLNELHPVHQDKSGYKSRHYNTYFVWTIAVVVLITMNIVKSLSAGSSVQDQLYEIIVAVMLTTRALVK